MPQAASKKQYRFMMAILHGKNVKEHDRGNPPKSVAAKYKDSETDGIPESKDNDRGGVWGAGAHKRAKSKVDKAREERKKRVKKSFEQFYSGRGAGCIVVNDKGQILIGESDGVWSLPGGHVNPNETFEEGAARELLEEANIVAKELIELGSFKAENNDSKTFLVTKFTGSPKNKDKEFDKVEWKDVGVVADLSPMRNCSKKSLKLYLESHLRKSLKGMLALEILEKNILRGPDGRSAVFDVSHGDALRLVGNGAFKMIRDVVKDMQDEDFKDIHIDDYVLSIRKHMNDIYSGRINHGNKMIHQFMNRSLPQLTAELMSVFEWYLPEDEPELIVTDMDDDIIEGGMETLTDNYRKHNLANIYTEMENIRAEIRNDNAVDLMQTESKIMKLFDKLENYYHTFADKHNQLCNDAGNEMEELENKLRQLQSRVDELSNTPKSIEAYSPNPANSNEIHGEHYFYLSKPNVIIEPNGRIKITFGKEWSDFDRENFLTDMRAKVVKSRK